MSENQFSMMDLPHWVRKRNGQIVAFDSDVINRDVFTSTQHLKNPDVLLAGELTQGILHFLADEADGPTVSTEQIADVVIKVIRELGQPMLAEVLEARLRSERTNSETNGFAQDSTRPATSGLSDWLRLSPDEAHEECLRQLCLQTCFASDVAQAHDEGLITLGGLHTPLTLSAAALTDVDTQDLSHKLADVAEMVGQVIVLPLLNPVEANATPEGAEQIWEKVFSDLHLVLRLTRREAIVNANAESPHPRTELGTLFEQSSPTPHNFISSSELLDAFQQWPDLKAQLDWHLKAEDFETSNRDRTLHAASASLRGANVRFVFDRSRRGIASWGDGIDRDHPAVLLTVGLHLDSLATRAHSLNLHNPESWFLDRVNSLAELALRAGLQKRGYLRDSLSESSSARQGFLLERARLLVTPIGLEHAVRLVTGQSLFAESHALEFAQKIIQQMVDALTQKSLPTGLDWCMDSSPGTKLLSDIHGQMKADTKSDPGVPIPRQIQILGSLHSITRSGTGEILLPQDTMTSPDQVVHWLHKAWKQGNVNRLRFVQSSAAPQQLSLE